MGYYNSDHQMIIAMRSLGSLAWTKTRINETVGWDSHNYVILEVDSVGYIHVSGNMHNATLGYYRSASRFLTMQAA